MTITNDFAGAALVLTDESRADEIAKAYADGYFPESDYHFTVTESTPTSLPVDLQDQIAAYQRDLGKPTKVLTLYPWPALSDSTLPERPTNGTIPR